jgi:hypothetical protein
LWPFGWLPVLLVLKLQGEVDSLVADQALQNKDGCLRPDGRTDTPVAICFPNYTTIPLFVLGTVDAIGHPRHAALHETP